MDDELKKKILDDIRATGFPTELEVAEILRTAEWDVDQNPTYLDYELNKSREIDVVARKIYNHKQDGKLKFYFGINLIIEIKKAPKKPWVIFTIPNKPRHKEFIGFLGPGFGQLTDADNFSTDKLSAENLMAHFPRNMRTTIGTSFYEAFKSPDEPSKIYEAVMSAIKAAFYVCYAHNGKDIPGENAQEEEEEPPFTFNPLAIQRLEIYMPIVLVDGVLCEAMLTSKKEIELKESFYIPLNISHTTKPYDGPNNFYPEMIHINHLPEFLQDIDRWGNSVKKLWKKT